MYPAFVHIGDAHMGPNARNADRWRALDAIVAENIGRPNLNAWLIPGDLNHARMTIDDRNAWAERLRTMANRAPVLICYGNHDVPGDLDVFGKLAATWPIHVVATPRVLSLVGPVASFTAFVLPYPTEAGLVSAGIGPADMISTAREALEFIFMDAGAQLEDARGRGERTLMMGHVNVAGSMTSVGQPNIGHEIEIDEALLSRLGESCYRGLNHIHKAQQIAGTHYPGSICRLDWGEIEPKGYVRVTWGPPCEQCGERLASCFGAYGDPGAEARYACEGCCGHGNEDGWCQPISEGGIAGVLPRWFVETCPLDVPPMYHVTGHLYRDRFDWHATKGPDGEVLTPPTTWKGSEVRVRATFYKSERALIEHAKAHIFANFAEANRFELELQPVLDHAVRAPEVAAAKTLSDKVTAWAAATLTVLPERVLPLVPLLEHGDPDVVLREALARVAELVEPAQVEESEVAVA